MRKIMLIGNVGCGKTTLSQRLMGEQIAYQKTQAIQVIGQDILDTPGEYLERRHFYNALEVASVDADVILLLVSAIDDRMAFSPRISALFFEKPVIGVITKTDLVKETEELSGAEMILELAGVTEVVRVGYGDEQCISELKKMIETAII